MGIDAEMLIRYRGSKPTDDQLNRWSWDLCSAIGAGKFFISDGVPPDEYGTRSEAWHKAFDSHPLAEQWRSKARDTREEIFADIGKCPDCLRRAIELTNRRYPLDEDSEVPATHRMPGKVWTQGGPPILAGPDEWFMEVSLWTRYYGPGYERGDILTICAVAEWVEQNMQPCEVWYGGDSSGVCAEPFPADKREEYRKLLYGPTGRDYYKWDERGTFPTPKPCGLCVPGENRFNRCGWGGNYVRVHCSGCGKSFTSDAKGEIWTLAKDD